MIKAFLKNRIIIFIIIPLSYSFATKIKFSLIYNTYNTFIKIILLVYPLTLIDNLTLLRLTLNISALLTIFTVCDLTVEYSKNVI